MNLPITRSYTVSSINRLPTQEKREIYSRLIPPELLQRFSIASDLHDSQGRDLLNLDCVAESPVVEMVLYPSIGFPDPLLYGQMTDTLNGKSISCSIPLTTRIQNASIPTACRMDG
jgi:hypothetical protein